MFMQKPVYTAVSGAVIHPSILLQEINWWAYWASLFCRTLSDFFVGDCTYSALFVTGLAILHQGRFPLNPGKYVHFIIENSSQSRPKLCPCCWSKSLFYLHASLTLCDCKFKFFYLANSWGTTLKWKTIGSHSSIGSKKHSCITKKHITRRMQIWSCLISVILLLKHSRYIQLHLFCKQMELIFIFSYLVGVVLPPWRNENVSPTFRGVSEIPGVNSDVWRNHA